MKKSLIVITIALLMIVPIFADTVDSATISNSAKLGGATPASDAQKTEVNVTLKLTPKYAFGVTGGEKASKSDATKYVMPYGTENYVIYTVKPATEETGKTYVDYTSLKRITVISMEADEANMVLKGPDADTYEYYISYWFFENNTENVKLIAKLDGNMILDTTDTTLLSDTTNSQIPYQVTIGSKGTLKSTDVQKDTDGNVTSAPTVEIHPATVMNKIGQSEAGDEKLTIEPITGSESIKDKYAGTYKANIILQVTVG